MNSIYQIVKKKMDKKRSYYRLFEAILCSLFLMGFSLFVHSSYPWKLISFTALTTTAFIFGRNLQNISDFRKILGVPASITFIPLFNILGAILGSLLAIIYRRYLGMSIVPDSGFRYFVFIAAFIGAIEELVFRGFIQEYAKSINAPFSIFLSAVSHTGYKCCLFILPLAGGDINIGLLAFWTFGAGLLFGALKHFSGTLFPAVLAHMVFDIFVYAEFLKAPWWVW